MLQFVISFRGTQTEEIKDIYTDINVTMVSQHDHENDSLRHFEHLMSLLNQLTISITVHISHLSMIQTYMISFLQGPYEPGNPTLSTLMVHK